MKIVHIGIPGFVISAIAHAECAEGHNSEAQLVLPEPFRLHPESPVMNLSQVLEPSATRPDVIVIHGLAGIAGLGNPEEPLRVLSEIKAAGIRTAFWAPAEEVDDLLRHYSPVFRNAFNACFSSDIKASHAIHQMPDLLYLPVPTPIPAGVLSFGQAREYARIPDGPLKVLHIPYRIPRTEVERIREAVQKVRNVELALREPERFSSLQDLVEEIQSADIVIENLGRDSYGTLGAVTLSAARPLFSGNTAEWRSNWQIMENCPVLPCTAETLSEKLRAVAVEPRTLRDFGKRSRQFAEHHHHPTRVAPLTLAAYRRLLSA